LTSTTLLVRSSSEADVALITAIYGFHVAKGTGTFETEPPSEGDMAARRSAVLSLGLPWLVACEDGKVVGFAYANRFRPRPAYRFFVEDSIYLAPGAGGRGIGRLLLGELIATCEELGLRQMVAVIGDSANAASIGLHRALGFEQTGLLRSSGRKFDRWLDVVLMQRSLGEGDASAPVERTS
jgi:phosphinothricin acetyltransferase